MAAGTGQTDHHPGRSARRLHASPWRTHDRTLMHAKRAPAVLGPELNGVISWISRNGALVRRLMHMSMHVFALVLPTVSGSVECTLIKEDGVLARGPALSAESAGWRTGNSYREGAMQPADSP